MSDTPHVTIDATVALQRLAALDKQTRFAASRAINDGILDAQKVLRAGFASEFTLRRPDFINKEGAKITKFSKRDDLTAEMGPTDRAAFLRDDVTGAQKRPRKQKLAIPADGVRRGKAGIVQFNERPANVLRSGGFILRSSRGVSTIRKRVTRGKNKGLRTLYTLVVSAVIKPVLRPVMQQAAAAARATFRRTFPDRLREALATAK